MCPLNVVFHFWLLRWLVNMHSIISWLLSIRVLHQLSNWADLGVSDTKLGVIISWPLAGREEKGNNQLLYQSQFANLLFLSTCAAGATKAGDKTADDNLPFNLLLFKCLPIGGKHIIGATMFAGDNKPLIFGCFWASFNLNYTFQEVKK